MFKALFLLVAIVGPLWLVYLLGFWVLAATGAMLAATIAFSTGKASPSEEHKGGGLTGYRTSFYADL
ncbi:hypothetical protein [Variovorax sp. GT1P44]|uniref:hypothetical protein n=1 Tax=Variovorax sp. GT1P44 TaxID=3443742 RepID=UPI003F47EB3C